MFEMQSSMLHQKILSSNGISHAVFQNSMMAHKDDAQVRALMAQSLRMGDALYVGMCWVRLGCARSNCRGLRDFRSLPSIPEDMTLEKVRGGASSWYSYTTSHFAIACHLAVPSYSGERDGCVCHRDHRCC